MAQQVHIHWIVLLLCAGALGITASAHAQAAESSVTVQTGNKQPTVPETTKAAVVSTDNRLVDARDIAIEGRPIRGTRDANVTIIEFDDFQCPFSARMHQALSEIIGQYGDRIRLITRDAPNILIHPWSIRAAVDANCLASQSTEAYWEFSDYLFANQNQVNSESTQEAQFVALDKLALEIGQKHQLEPVGLGQCVQAHSDTEVTQSRLDAKEKVGITGVPTMFINGEKITGVMTAQQLRERIDGALRAAAQPVPKSTTTVTVPTGEAAPSSASSHRTTSTPDF